MLCYGIFLRMRLEVKLRRIQYKRYYRNFLFVVNGKEREYRRFPQEREKFFLNIVSNSFRESLTVIRS
ncbi:hypothetical protein EAJ17_04400 [Akkermansia sp. aa_0143]|nr:hypothetical protein EAJ17_04400 [Akkermansia sp. aa_0143]